MNYKPIVLAIYGNQGNKYHLMYDNKEEEISRIMNKGQFNEKLHKMFEIIT